MTTSPPKSTNVAPPKITANTQAGKPATPDTKQTSIDTNKKNINGQTKTQQRDPVLRHADEAVATILVRQAYTRERHYLLIRVIIALAGALMFQAVLIYFLATKPPVNYYFSTDRDGRIQPLTPIDKPIGSLIDLSTWVANSVIEAYTFDFANWRTQLSRARNNFTPSGWKGFETALRDSGVLQTVREKKYVTSAVPTSAPVLVSQGMIQGRYAWKFQIPILVTYQSSEKTVPQNLMIEVLVVRISETENPRGLGIAQLIAQ